MKRPRMLLGICLGAVFVAAALAAALMIWARTDARLDFTVVDSLSGSWVWDFTARIQDRFTRGYCQSDVVPAVFLFTRLAPGQAMLQVSAPHY